MLDGGAGEVETFAEIHSDSNTICFRLIEKLPYLFVLI